MFWYNFGKVLVLTSTPLLFVAVCQLKVEITRYRERMRVWLELQSVKEIEEITVTEQLLVLAA